MGPDGVTWVCALLGSTAEVGSELAPGQVHIDPGHPNDTRITITSRHDTNQFDLTLFPTRDPGAGTALAHVGLPVAVEGGHGVARGRPMARRHRLT